MEIVSITTAEELFLDDVSAEDYQEIIADHELECTCVDCGIFERLLELDRKYTLYLEGSKPENDEEIMKKKFVKYTS